MSRLPGHVSKVFSLRCLEGVKCDAQAPVVGLFALSKPSVHTFTPTGHTSQLIPVKGGDVGSRRENTLCHLRIHISQVI